MRLISALILLLIVQISSANITSNHPINPDIYGENYGRSSLKNPALPFGVSSISTDGRFIAYFTEHENLEDNTTVDYIAHRYDRTSNTILSSDRIIKKLDRFSYQYIQVSFEDATAQNIVFSHLKPDISSSTEAVEFSGFSISRYDFENKNVSNYKSDVGLGWSMSPSGQYFIYISLNALYIFDKESGIERPVPISHTLANGSVIEFVKPGVLFTHHSINDQGDIVLVTDSDSMSIENVSQYYKYNIRTGVFVSLKDLLPLDYDFYSSPSSGENLRFSLNIPLVSNNGRYISLVARNSLEQPVILLLDTVSLNVTEHFLPFDIKQDDFLRPRLITNSGIAQYVGVLEDRSSLDVGKLVYYSYDFSSKTVLENSSIPIDDLDNIEYRLKMVDQISLDSSFTVTYDALIKNTSNQEGLIGTDFKSSLYWSYIPSLNGIKNKIAISPSDIIIDPYSNQASQFSIDVSGTDIYGLDVSCDLSSTSLSVTQASYNGLFNSQNTMRLPLIYDATSITGTETLIAPELPLSGAGSFVLADIIAEFTTEDVQVTCAAELSDENGQLLQVTLTPATIRIDDGVHGGAGAASGMISIPGVTDLSGVEVVLTINGRQVMVTTDETGRFEFDALRDGDFTISLSSENYVQSCQSALIAGGGAVNLGTIELLAGDINGDGSIDIADFTFMAARYRSSQGDADYDAKADLNNDAVINIQDLAILGSHFGSTQCNSFQ